MAEHSTTPLAALHNIGPTTGRWLAEIGIQSLDELRALGSVEAYARLRFRFGGRVTRNALHALEAVIRGTDWRALSPADKAALDEAVRLRGQAPPAA